MKKEGQNRCQKMGQKVDVYHFSGKRRNRFFGVSKKRVKKIIVEHGHIDPTGDPECVLGRVLSRASLFCNF